jgi:hypothetical protein
MVNSVEVRLHNRYSAVQSGGNPMAETRIPVQEIHFEGHRARVDAVYESDGSGRYSFVKFELIEQKRRGRPPGKRRNRKPGPKPDSKRRKKAAQANAAE